MSAPPGFYKFYIMQYLYRQSSLLVAVSSISRLKVYYIHVDYLPPV